ncbi:MAG: DNA polymerase III subunit beta [Methylovulum sp.]|jgi:DNA polymerase-3 subunit beta|nr:DNA polymerase III subunit beta [Methylovulum sp.]TSA38466.1 MAG: DNA polymerase III subunit beta [Methylococcaceae bacterium]
MKLIIAREKLLPYLAHIVGVIEKRQTMPILSNVLMIIDNQQLTLIGTDLEIQMVANIAIDQDTSWVVSLSARKLLDICRLLPNGSILKLEKVDDKVKLLANRSRFSLNSLPAEHFPIFNQDDFENSFYINAAQLKKGIEKTTFCMAVQDVRYYLNGLLLIISNCKLKLIASDGHRLAIFEDVLAIATGVEKRLIIPRKCIIELSKLLGDIDSDVKVDYSGNSVRFGINNLLLSSKLIEGNYPDFSKVFQQEFCSAIFIEKQILKDALARVAILSHDKIKGISLDINAHSLRISTHNMENDEAEEELSIEFGDQPFSIAFNAQYLFDAISNISVDFAKLIFSKNASTCFIEESGDSNYQFIVMPMRL